MKIAIVGLGYVGLPLSALLARDFDVIGFEIDTNRVKRLEAGETLLTEPGLEELLPQSIKSGKLKFTTTPSDIADADVKIITVGTPYDEKKNDVDYSFLDSALEIVTKQLKKGDIVVLKSTVPVGTTSNRVAKAIKESGFKVPEEIGVVFSPERIVEGQAMNDYKVLPKIIGASDDRSYAIFAQLATSLGGKIVKVSNPETAEMVKMTDNYARFAFLAITNELALACEKMGVDVMEMLAAAKNDYSRNAGLLIPGPGVGGSCLNKDPFILRANLENKGLSLKMVGSAKEINFYVPKHIAEMVTMYRKEAKVVAIAGVAFKGETDDTRFTSTFPIRDLLSSNGITVKLSDPYVKIDGVTTDIYKASEGADVFILITNHNEYKQIDFKRLKSLMGMNPLIIDARAFIDRKEVEALGFEYHGFGRL